VVCVCLGKEGFNELLRGLLSPLCFFFCGSETPDTLHDRSVDKEERKRRDEITMKNAKTRLLRRSLRYINPSSYIYEEGRKKEDSLVHVFCFHCSAAADSAKS
jgi:hypothetical protein